jgi:hypothetical protein
MEEGEEFRSGLAGQAGQGVTAKVGGWGSRRADGEGRGHLYGQGVERAHDPRRPKSLPDSRPAVQGLT